MTPSPPTPGAAIPTPTRSRALQAELAGELRGLRADQQPEWDHPDRLVAAREAIGRADDVVGLTEPEELTGLLAAVSRGEMCVLQAGDCAEDPSDSDPAAVARKVELLDVLSEVVRAGSDRPVLRVGRMAGQFAKPRSSPREQVANGSIPAYRGPAVNSPETTPSARRADPTRLVTAHTRSRRVAAAVDALGRGNVVGSGPDHERVWLSHEMLLLDYELPQVRATDDGRRVLTSTHWPWLGERTRSTEGAHAALLSRIDNPVAVKIGPDASVDEVLTLCARLDPARRPGRLTLISRFGADRVSELGTLVAAVARAGHPVVWLCDPMHGNTTTRDDGLKIRSLDDVVAEIDVFCTVLAEHDAVGGGLHLEATPDPVRECDGAGTCPDRAHYLTLCDPRLNLVQGVVAAAHWRPGGAPGREATT